MTKAATIVLIILMIIAIITCIFSGCAGADAERVSKEIETELNESNARPDLPEGYYPTVLEVIAVNYTDDIVYFENSVHYQYSIVGADDICVGDAYSAIMYDNGTPKIYDDIIVSLRYSSYGLIAYEDLIGMK